MIQFERHNLVKRGFYRCIRQAGIVDYNVSISFSLNTNLIRVQPKRMGFFNSNKQDRVKQVFKDLASSLDGEIIDSFSEKHWFELVMPKDLPMQQMENAFDNYLNHIKSKNAIKKYNL